jgi:hypothetical protein
MPQGAQPAPHASACARRHCSPEGGVAQVRDRTRRHACGREEEASSSLPACNATQGAGNRLWVQARAHGGPRPSQSPTPLPSTAKPSRPWPPGARAPAGWGRRQPGGCSCCSRSRRSCSGGARPRPPLGPAAGAAPAQQVRQGLRKGLLSRHLHSYAGAARLNSLGPSAGDWRARQCMPMGRRPVAAMLLWPTPRHRPTRSAPRCFEAHPNTAPPCHAPCRQQRQGRPADSHPQPARLTRAAAGAGGGRRQRGGAVARRPGWLRRWGGWLPWRTRDVVCGGTGMMA